MGLGLRNGYGLVKGLGRSDRQAKGKVIGMEDNVGKERGVLGEINEWMVYLLRE